MGGLYTLTPASDDGRGFLLGAGPSVRLQAAPNESDHRAPLAEDGPTRSARVGHGKAPG
jgi:hypothetical protein